MNGPDFRSADVPNQHAMRDLDALPWAPRPSVNWRGLIGGTAVSVLLLGFLYALLVVGPK